MMFTSNKLHVTLTEEYKKHTADKFKNALRYYWLWFDYFKGYIFLKTLLILLYFFKWHFVLIFVNSIF